jgi:hypothetical protein
MSGINVNGIVASGLAAMFSLGSQLVKAATYTRPPTYSSSTGLQTSAEITVSCSIFAVSIQSGEFGLVVVQPEDDRVFIRASELTGIPSPQVGDYITETVSGLRRDVVSIPKTDPTGQLWTFHTARTLNLDWGTISVAFGDSEDWGDLTAAASSDDWGAIV